MMYTKAELMEKIDHAAHDVGTLYTAPMVNYTGKTSDTDELYSEVIARYIEDHLTLFAEILPIPRAGCYNMKHTGHTAQKSSRLTEKRLAMSLFGKELPFIGKVIDYQTPLKNVQKDKAGEIDLLAWNAAKNTLYLLELKAPKSEETILRCALEAYTYLKIADRTRLLADFALPATAVIAPTVLICENSPQHTMLSELGGFQRSLFGHLGIEIFLLNIDNTAVNPYEY